MAATTVGTNCDAGNNCWTTNSSAVATFISNKWNWGTGSTVLGQVNDAGTFTLSGAQSVSKPLNFHTTREVNLIMEGERLKCTGAHPEGESTSGNTFSSYGPIDVPANSTVPWYPNGYKAYTKDGDHQTIVHEMSWTTTGYSGQWYFYFKTQKFITTDFVVWSWASPSDRCADTFHGGWFI